MSDKPISPLRRRMIEDMTVRNFVLGETGDVPILNSLWCSN